VSLLLLLLQECGIAMSLDEVREMISDADTNKDGLINYEEFSAMMRKVSGRAHRNPPDR
jgi:Ca2+-binding EF-hand superfamily protein